MALVAGEEAEKRWEESIPSASNFLLEAGSFITGRQSEVLGGTTKQPGFEPKAQISE